MSTAIAFLSGKGGSGKTTLALSTADLLRRCGVPTLLVDCDLSTNGATYFYESQLANQDRTNQPTLLSFYGLLKRGDIMDELSPLKIDTNLGFVPSTLETLDTMNQHSEEEELMVSCGCSPELQLQNFLKWARGNYEVILFDCQAGYAEFFPILLPLMDADLFVMEADSISASAMRSLHLKIGNFFGRARLYQVFNKATQEEVNIYSKVVGTFFTNIGILLFDWKIRQAFSRSQTPGIENTSAQYGSDLCNICKIMLTGDAVQGKVRRLSNQLHRQQLEEQREQIEEKLYEPTGGSAPKRYLLFACAGACILLVAVFWIVCSFWKMTNSPIDELGWILIFATALGIAVAVECASMLSSYRLPRKVRRAYKKKLNEIDEELEELEELNNLQ